MAWLISPRHSHLHWKPRTEPTYKNLPPSRTVATWVMGEGASAWCCWASKFDPRVGAAVRWEGKEGGVEEVGSLWPCHHHSDTLHHFLIRLTQIHPETLTVFNTCVFILMEYGLRKHSCTVAEEIYFSIPNIKLWTTKFVSELVLQIIHRYYR